MDKNLDRNLQQGAVLILGSLLLKGVVWGFERISGWVKEQQLTAKDKKEGFCPSCPDCYPSESELAYRRALKAQRKAG